MRSLVVHRVHSQLTETEPAEQQSEAAASYPVEVLDTGDGLYTVQYRVNQADTYRTLTLTVTLTLTLTQR